MGMFDNISVADPLPFTSEMRELGLDINNRSFQTKDLECVLAEYIIQGGKLFERKYKEEKWIEGDSKSENWLDRIGRIERGDPYLEPVNYHGEIYFYDWQDNVNEKWDCWVEFKAIFSNGVVDRYELLRFDKTDNTDRLIREKQWKEEMERAEKVWYNKYFRHTRPYRWFSNKWYRVFNTLGHFCNKAAMWV